MVGFVTLKGCGAAIPASAVAGPGKSLAGTKSGAVGSNLDELWLDRGLVLACLVEFSTMTETTGFRLAGSVDFILSVAGLGPCCALSFGLLDEEAGDASGLILGTAEDGLVAIRTSEAPKDW